MARSETAGRDQPCQAVRVDHPGSHHPFHDHDVARVWYIRDGEFPTETGRLMPFVQYQGPTTGGRPIYGGRFTMAARKPAAGETIEA